VPISTKLRVTDGTAKKTYEQLVLVSGLRQFLPFVIMLSAPTPPPLTLQLFLDFFVLSQKLFPRVWHLFKHIKLLANQIFFVESGRLSVGLPLAGNCYLFYHPKGWQKKTADKAKYPKQSSTRNSGINGIEDVCLKADYKERKKDYTIFHHLLFSAFKSIFR